MNKKILNRIVTSPTITTWMSYFTKSINLVILLPLVIDLLNDSDIAIWYLFSNVIGLQLLIDSGFSGNFVRYISFALNGNRSIFDKSINENLAIADIDFLRTISFAMTEIYRVLIIALVLIYSTFGFYAFKLPIQLTTDSNLGWIVWTFTLIALPILIYGGKYSNILQGLNKIPLLRLWETFFNLFSSVFSIVILLVTKNVYFVVISLYCWSLLSVFRNYFIVRKIDLINSGTIDFSILKKMKPKLLLNSLKSGTGVLMAQGITYSVAFFFANKLDPSSLTTYLVTSGIIINIRNFSQAPFYSKIPFFATLTANQNIQELKRCLKRSMFQVYLIFFTSSLLLYLLFWGYLERYSVSFILDKKLWFILTLAFFLERYGAMHIQIYSLSNHILWHIHNGVSGVITIIFVIIIYQYAPLYSYPLALLISCLLFYSIYGPYYSYKYLNTSFWKFEKKLFFPWLIILTSIAVYILMV